jgi:glycosyltransferase involved in cell wall biosynthesis
MTALPLVSVIIPAHNAASDLPRAVASVLDQTVSSLEVVIVDDASSDATAEVAERLAAADPRVVLHRAPRNLGPAGARNLGIEAARGTWLALLDSDDAYLPGRLEALLELAEHTGAEMLADNLLFAGGPAGGPATVMLPPDLLRAPRQVGAAGFLIGNLPDRRHPRVSYGFLKPLFRREFLVQHGIRYDGRLRFAEDFDLYLRCLVAGARFWLTPEAGYLYTIREGSLTDTHTARDLLRLRRVDRRLMLGPKAAADRRLHGALRRHLRSIDRRAIWRLFTDALKGRAWRRAARIGLLSSYSACVVASELTRVAPRRLGRLLRPAAATHPPPLSRSQTMTLK